MNAATEVFGDVLVVHAPEELNEEHAAEFLRLLTAQDPRRVVVDLDAVESLDSPGLATLLDAQDVLRGDGGDLKVIAGNTVNRKILEITRLDVQLEVFESVLDAVKSFA